MTHISDLRIKISKTAFFKKVSDLLAKSAEFLGEHKTEIQTAAETYFSFVRKFLKAQRKIREIQVQALTTQVRRRFYSFLTQSEAQLDSLVARISPDREAIRGEQVAGKLGAKGQAGEERKNLTTRVSTLKKKFFVLNKILIHKAMSYVVSTGAYGFFDRYLSIGSNMQLSYTIS